MSYRPEFMRLWLNWR